MKKLYIILLIALGSLVYSYPVILPSVFFKVGKSKFDTKQYDTASAYFSAALKLKPDEKEYRYYYVKSLTALQPTYKIQKAIYEIASDGKDDSAQILASNAVLEWKRNVNNTFGTTYIEQAPSGSNIIRWNKNSFPLNVFIDTSSASNLPEYYKDAVVRALKQWEHSVDFISFKYVDNKEYAQILIAFKATSQNICSQKICHFVAGTTEPDIRGSKLRRMTITLYDKIPNGKYFSDKEIYNTILHEIGHALGIQGHSYSSSDLMYRQNMEDNGIYSKYRSDFHYLSGSDIRTLQLLYTLEPNITDSDLNENSEHIYAPIVLGSGEEMTSKKIKEALDYVKNTPNLAIGYINLAGAYVDAEDYHKAIKALDSALDVAADSEEKYIIYYNYAYIYEKLKKHDTALKYAELAKGIKATPDILELIGIIEHNKYMK